MLETTPTTMPLTMPPATLTTETTATMSNENTQPTPVYPIRTKVVATVGPASESPEAIDRLIDAGVNVFRFNFSHGSLDDHAKRCEVVRAEAKKRGATLAILGDLQGPKIRVGKCPDEGIMLTPGQDVIIRRNVDVSWVADDGVAVLNTTYEELIEEVKPGQRVLINDGAIRMLAVEDAAASAARELRCRVTVGGKVTSSKGINLPESDVAAPAITERDWECVEFAVEHGFDFLALSFVRTPNEVNELKAKILELCSKNPLYATNEEFGASIPAVSATIPVVSKIEKPQALENIEGIVDASDAIMVARGDLGVEMDIAHTPVAQKKILEVCGRYGKPCIVATQMLETMVESASPTRAEASDVANAIIDMADAVMLSAETATGVHPPLVVETMRRIAHQAELFCAFDAEDASTPPQALREARDVEAAIAHGCWHVARDLEAKMVVCWSQVGRMARYLSQNRFNIPIVACSSSDLWTRRMALLSNVTPLRMDPPSSGKLADWTDAVESDLVARGWVDPGDLVVLAAGKPLGDASAVNTISVLRVGDFNTGFRQTDRS